MLIDAHLLLSNLQRCSSRLAPYHMLSSLVTPPPLDLGIQRSKPRTVSRAIPVPITVNEPESEATTNPVTRTTVSLEYASLRHNDHCPLGMYVVPSTDNLLVWDGVFFVHQGKLNRAAICMQSPTYAHDPADRCSQATTQTQFSNFESHSQMTIRRNPLLYNS